MGDRTKLQLEADRRIRTLRRALGTELRQNREDQGHSQRAIAHAAGIDPSHLCRIEAGDTSASLESLSRAAAALGGEIRLRFYPGTGTRIRDHLSAAVTDALLQNLHPRWKRFLEVPVYRPSRGVIDLVLHDPEASVVVASEIQSELRRLEQTVRWSHQKQDALPSADLWARIGSPTISSLMVIRSTRTNRLVVNEHTSLLATALPARTADVLAALRHEGAWPGAGIVWAEIDAGRARILDGPPRGVRLGR
jgi:transcriptional regulator with XRE-family HTH domain